MVETSGLEYAKIHSKDKRIDMKQYESELILDTRAEVGEGPIWVNDTLYWVDITEGGVHAYNPQTGKNRSTYIGEAVGTVVPCASGGLAVAAIQGFCSLEFDTGKLSVLNNPEAGNLKTRFNDGKCDPAGRFWAGSCPLDEESPIGTLYRLDSDHTVHPQLKGLKIPNGIVWSHDNSTMYYIDTPTQRVDAFDYHHDSGNITNQRIAFEIPEEMGLPDGMTIDADGNIWIGMWGGYGVTHWNPESGEYLGKVEVPSAQVTSCAFGGANLDELYITSARRERSAEQLKDEPHAGGLFKARVGVPGVPAFEFAG